MGTNAEKCSTLVGKPKLLPKNDQRGKRERGKRESSNSATINLRVNSYSVAFTNTVTGCTKMNKKIQNNDEIWYLLTKSGNTGRTEANVDK